MLNEGIAEENEEQALRVEEENQVIEPTNEELEEVLNKLKNNKSPGQNGIKAERT